MYSSDPNIRGAPNIRGDRKISTKIGMKNIQKGYFTTFFRSNETGRYKISSFHYHFCLISFKS